MRSIHIKVGEICCRDSYISTQWRSKRHFNTNKTVSITRSCSQVIKKKLRTQSSLVIGWKRELDIFVSDFTLLFILQIGFQNLKS